MASEVYSQGRYMSCVSEVPVYRVAGSKYELSSVDDEYIVADKCKFCAQTKGASLRNLRFHVVRMHLNFAVSVRKNNKAEFMLVFPHGLG